MTNKNKTIEKLLENIDEKSSEFRALSNIDTFLDLLKNKVDLNEAAINIIDGELTISIAEKVDKATTLRNIEEHLKIEVAEDLKEKILQETENFIKNNLLYEDVINKNISPTQALESIKERLSQSVKIAPVKRDYSLEKSSGESTQSQNITKPSIDPYREIPDKD